MNIEALKQQLAEGKITKEQFAAELKKLLDAGTIDQAAHDAAIAEAEKGEGDKDKDKKNDPPGNGFNDEQMAAIQKMLQSEGDKIRTQYTKEKKQLEDELEQLRKDKMTKEEQAEYERQKWEKEKADKEAELNRREIALHTIDKLTEAKLPLSFKSFLAATSKEDTDKNIDEFAKLWQSEIKAAVDAKFKENGGDPPGNKGGNKGPKKWADMTLTEQGQLYRENPEKARELAKAAGVKLK